ncbi:MAG: BRCT domain-containing protein [Planctomycetota bacterium]
MARVVQRRPGPPYLLIVFVFAFLIATTLAVLFYTRQSDAREELAEREETLNRIATAADRKKGYVQERLQAGQMRGGTVEYKGPEGRIDPDQEVRWARSVSVVGRLDQHLGDLARTAKPGMGGEDAEVVGLSTQAYNELQTARQYAARKAGEPLVGAEQLARRFVATADGEITWDQVSPEDPAAVDVLPHEGWSGVLKELKFAYEQRLAPQRDIAQTLKMTLAAAQAENDTLGRQLAEANEQAQSWKDKFRQAEAKLTDTSRQLDACRTDLKDKNTRIEDLETVLEETQAGLESAEAELTEVQARVQEQQRLIAELKRDRRQRDFERTLERIRTRPDGQVIRVAPDQNLCYINLGLEQGINVGTTFAVHPAKGISVPPKSKGKIEVIRANPDTSACRILEQSADDPIVQNDFVANIAFDATREYTFVVAGQFDLYGSGRPSPSDRREIVALIERFGGKVVDEVDVNVDYAVLGQRPELPERPETPEEEERFRHIQKQIERYRTVKKQAQELDAWILNTNRFLDLVGYPPTRTVQRP